MKNTKKFLLGAACLGLLIGLCAAGQARASAQDSQDSQDQNFWMLRAPLADFGSGGGIILMNDPPEVSFVNPTPIFP